jgi:hypothetical protein
MEEKKLIGYLLILIVVILVLILVFGPKGWANSVIKSISALVLQYMPFSGDNGYRDKTPIEGVFGPMYNSFEIAAKPSNTNCYYKIPSMPKDFDEKWYSIENTDGKIFISFLQYDKQNKMDVATKIDFISPSDQSQIGLCAITGINLEKFQAYLSDGQIKPQHDAAAKIEIIKSKSSLFGTSRKGLFVDGSKNDYEEIYLYKGDNNNICMVPAYEGKTCDVANGMISARCFESKFAKQCT